MLDDVLRWLGLGLCHQLPERSFFGGGVQVPVCGRCTGIYLGFVVGLGLIAWFERSRRATEPPPLPVIGLLVGGILVMALDGVTFYAGMRETTNDIRLATGLAAGLGIAGLTAPLLNSVLWSRSTAARVLSSPAAVGAYVVAGPASWALATWVLPSVGVAYPVIVGAAIVVTFTVVNMVLVCLLPPFERRATRLRGAWVAIGVAFLLTVTELAMSAGFRLVLTRLAVAIQVR